MDVQKRKRQKGVQPVRNANTDKPDYRGKRALILTRVSTAIQEKKYSHAAQERTVREKLIEPLGLRLDENRHIIHDTYTGLEYRYRQALEDILAMAERQEFDVLCMDVLDRGLGRKALARELFRMQLRELGVRILTTQESDHADDDTLEGQIIRFIKGYKAEDEVNDLVRRTNDGKREKALGNEEKGIPQKIVGTGGRLYGYKYVHDENSVRIGYELNLDIILVDANGKEWTEVTVVIFIYESAASGVPVRTICKQLNAMKILSPYLAKGMHQKNMNHDPSWQPIAVSRILHNSAYYGKFRQFRTASLGRKPGYKTIARRHTSEDEQVIIDIPAIVTQKLAETAQKRIAKNRQKATRNNQTSKESLLRGGFAKCAYCGTTLRVHRKINTRKTTGKEVAYFSYNCAQPYNKVGRCQGCSISVDELDNAAKAKAVAIIHDSSEVDNKIAQLITGNPNIEQCKRRLKNLTDIRREQETLRNNLNKVMRKEKLDEKTVAYLNGQLGTLAQQERDAVKLLADEQAVQEKYNKLQERIAEFHQTCQEWREKLNDSSFTPSFQFWHDAIEFFGISVTVWRTGTKPRYEIYTDPPEIVELLSW
jgi:site-specific DNA recombinase